MSLGRPPTSPVAGNVQTVRVDVETAAEHMADLVSSRPGRPLIVAVDGASAAGTQHAGRRSGTATRRRCRGRRRLLPRPARQRRAALTPAEGVDQYFDWQGLRHEVLQPLRAGHAARYRPYDWLAGSGLGQQIIKVPPTPVIVVDGVYSARPELRNEIDLAVLVETPWSERHRRLIARGHGNDAWWPRWNAAEDLYFATIRPAHSFDLVVPGL